MKLFYLLPLFLSSFLSIKAQPGYLVNATVVTKNGDTLTGYIERVRDNLLSESVNFKQDATNKQTTQFRPEDLTSFTFQDNNLHYEPVTYRHIVNSNVVNEDRFALLLVKGYYSLYFLELKEEEVNIIFEQNNSHVFIAKKENVFTTLKQSESMEGSSYKLVKNYIDTLLTLFSDCPSVTTDEIKETDFFKKSMTRIFSAYNRCIQPDLPSETFTASQKFKINAGAYVAYPFYLKKNVSSTGGFSLGFLIGFTNPAFNERLSVSAGFTYSALQGNFEQVKGKQQLYGVPLKATYFMGNGKIKPFLSFGIIPTLATIDSLNETSHTHSKPEWLVFGSFGPGISLGKVNAAFLMDRAGIFDSRDGTYFNCRLGFTL